MLAPKFAAFHLHGGNLHPSWGAPTVQELPDENLVGLLDALFQIMVTNPHTLDDDSDDGEEGEFYPSEEEEEDDDVASNPEQMAID